MKRTLGYLKPYKSTVALALVIKFLGTVSELFLPMLLEYIINDAVPAGDVTLTSLLGVGMFVCALGALFGNIIANRLSVKASGNMTHDLRYDLFEKTSYLKCGQVDEYGIPSLISRMTSDTYYVNQMVARTMRMGVRAPILLIGGVLLTFILDPVLALVLLATVPFVAIALFLITRKSIPMYFSVQKSGDDMVRCMQENATGIRVIKALSKTEYENEKFASVTNKLAKDEYKANTVMSLSNPLATLILSMGLVAVIAVGSLRANEAGTVLAFLSYFTIILNALIGISKIFVVISRGTASASRIETVLAADCTERVEEHCTDDKRYKIRFKDVSFSYNGTENNLSGVDFALEKGKTLGIIGATGSGKSTVINLLMRFYDAGSGRIFVDGKDVRSYTASELRAKFGTAFQNDFLSSSTIRENIDYGRGLDESEIMRAVRAAQAEEFVASHGEGLDYVLAQKGLNLSGGQKQRLLIARALAGNPEILILDDSSSALDYATDAELRKALTEEYGGITKIIVAQRISSIRSADLIIVLDDGEVIGKGTHEQLLKTCGEYSLIFAEQMGADV